MDFAEYQEKIKKTANYPQMGNNFIYPALGLTGESGEVVDKLKKHIRDDGIESPADLSPEQRLELAKELGDVLWYVARMSTEIGYDFNEVARLNIEKTYSRLERGKIGGSGDNR